MVAYKIMEQGTYLLRLEFPKTFLSPLNYGLRAEALGVKSSTEHLSNKREESEE